MIVWSTSWVPHPSRSIDVLYTLAQGISPQPCLRGIPNLFPFQVPLPSLPLCGQPPSRCLYHCDAKPLKLTTSSLNSSPPEPASGPERPPSGGHPGPSHRPRNAGTTSAPHSPSPLLHPVNHQVLKIPLLPSPEGPVSLSILPCCPSPKPPAKPPCVLVHCPPPAFLPPQSECSSPPFYHLFPFMSQSPPYSLPPLCVLMCIFSL